MSVIVFSLPGGIPVYAFSLLLGLGVSVGLAWVAWQARRQNALPRFEAGLWALFGAMIGSRVAFVAVNWAYFETAPWEIAQIYLGGLSWSGALAGGLLALVMYATLARQSLRSLADALLPLAATLTLSVWLGCWIDGCAYGQPVAAWWAVPARDEWGNLTLRWPVQLAGALFTVSGFWLLDRYRASWPPGTAASLALLGMALQTFALSFLRADPGQSWRGLRLDAWAALAFFGIAMLALLGSSLRLVRRQNG